MNSLQRFVDVFVQQTSVEIVIGVVTILILAAFAALFEEEGNLRFRRELGFEAILLLLGLGLLLLFKQMFSL